MKAIILAGGFATRLWPLTENRAKPLLHLKDRPLISHIIEGLPENIPLIISTNSLFEDDFKQWAKKYPGRQISVFVEDSDSEEFKKGALGATALVIEKEKIDEDLLLIAGDNYFGFRMSDFIKFFSKNPLLAAYEIGSVEAAKKFGVVVTKAAPARPDGKMCLHVSEFQEKPQFPKSTLVSTGCYIFPKKNLNDIVTFAKMKKDDLGGIFEYLLKKNETIDVYSFHENWFDVGSFEGYLKANKDLLSGQVIENGKTMKSGKNVFRGGVYLGSGVSVSDSTLEDCVILDSCKIDNCVLRNCIIDENCVLTNIDLNYKMIRKGSVITK